VLPQKVAAAVVGAFGAVGLLLSMVGIYGVVAYHVSQRRREFGIRLTLGAGRSALVRLVLRRGFMLIGIAVGTGSLLAIGVTTLARRFLFGLGALDPLTFVAVPVLLTVVAVLASYIPARRAGHADPIESLRAE
jgi:ABC-type antimicrobial peptide transport system permease subunit